MDGLNVCIDDFERRAALCIDGSRKSLAQLVVELRTMLESRLFIGEQVRFGCALNQHTGRVIDCIELQTADGVERKYAVLCDRKLHKNLNAAQLKRTREVSDVDLGRFIIRMASQSFITKVWSVNEDYWGNYEFSFDLNICRLWKRTKDDLKTEQRSMQIITALRLLFLFSVAASIPGYIAYTSYTDVPIERPNIRFADAALHAMRQMNDETANYFWKWVVTDDKLNLADPSALEGIAHLFAFESTHSNRTTLREYVERMPADPPAIFFAYGESKDELKELPAVHSLIADNHEVILLTNKLDRKALLMITWFEGKTLMDARWYEHSKQTDG